MHTPGVAAMETDLVSFQFAEYGACLLFAMGIYHV